MDDCGKSKVSLTSNITHRGESSDSFSQVSKFVKKMSGSCSSSVCRQEQGADS